MIISRLGHGQFILLQDRPWISQWIKSISDELDLTFYVLASHLPSHDVCCTNNGDANTSIAQPIVTSSTENKQANWGTVMMSANRVLIAIDVLIMSWEIIYIYIVLRRTVYALARGLFRCRCIAPSREYKNRSPLEPINCSLYTCFFTWNVIS